MDCIFHCGDIHFFFNSVLWLILQIIKSRTPDNSPQGAAAENRPKDEVDTELTVTDSQTDQVKPEECSTAQESETPEHTEEIKTPSKGEEVPQQTQNEQGRVVEAEQLEESEPLNERIPGDISAWYQADNEGENILSTEKEEKSYRNRSPGKDPGFDLASSSFHIDITEDTQQTTEVRRETGQVSTAETQETVHRLALMKIQ